MNEPLEIILALQYIVNIHCLALRFFPYTFCAQCSISPPLLAYYMQGGVGKPRIGVAHCPLEDRK